MIQRSANYPAHQFRNLIVAVLTVLAVFATTVVLAPLADAKRSQGTIVVANRESGTLTLIDVATDSPTKLEMPPAENPSSPMYVVHARGNVFVGDRGNDRVVVFDKSDWSVVGEVPTDAGVFHMWADPSGRELWVNNDVDNTITVIDTRKLAVSATIALPADLTDRGGKPHDVILDRKAAYVTMLGLDGDSDVVIKYDRRNLSEVARADVGKDPHVTLAPNRKQLFVASQDSSEVAVLNRRDLAAEGVLGIPGAHGIDIDRKGRNVYVTNISGGGTDALHVLDGRNLTPIGDPVDSPYPVPHNIVLTGANDKLYLTHSGGTSAKVTVYTVSKRNPEPVYLTEVNVGLNPFGLEFVP